MFWNRKDEPFIVKQAFNYPRVIIKTPYKDIEGYIKEVDFDYLYERSKVFIVYTEREHPITREKTGSIVGLSIEEVEGNDWYMKITHDNKTLYETRPKIKDFSQFEYNPAELRRALSDEPISEPNLLEIKLKDTDSVPEVYYKGEKVEGLLDVTYHYRTTTDVVDGSANDINIEYYSTTNDKYLDKKIIGHKREM